MTKKHTTHTACQTRMFKTGEALCCECKPHDNCDFTEDTRASDAFNTSSKEYKEAVENTYCSRETKLIEREENIEKEIEKAREDERSMFIKEFVMANKILAPTDPLTVLRGILTADEMKLLDSLTKNHD